MVGGRKCFFGGAVRGGTVSRQLKHGEDAAYKPFARWRRGGRGRRAGRDLQGEYRADQLEFSFVGRVEGRRRT
jgi:hypothetical protein